MFTMLQCVYKCLHHDVNVASVIQNQRQKNNVAVTVIEIRTNN